MGGGGWGCGHREPLRQLVPPSPPAPPSGLHVPVPQAPHTSQLRLQERESGETGEAVRDTLTWKAGGGGGGVGGALGALDPTLPLTGCMTRQVTSSRWASASPSAK